jgi:hypothetical protein
VEPEDVEVGEAEEAAVDEKDQETIEEEEAEVDKDTGGEVFYVDLNADAGGDVADDGFGHAVDPNGTACKGILEQADGGSGEAAGDGIAARDGKEDGHDEWKIEDGVAGKGSGEKRLQQDRAQWHQESDGGREAVLFELSAGCIAAGCHKDRVWFSDWLELIAMVGGWEAGLNRLGVLVCEALWAPVALWLAMEWMWRMVDW